MVFVDAVWITIATSLILYYRNVSQTLQTSYVDKQNIL